MQYQKVVTKLNEVSALLDEITNDLCINCEKSKLLLKLKNKKQEYYYINSNHFDTFHLPERHICIIISLNNKVSNRIQDLEKLIKNKLID